MLFTPWGLFNYISGIIQSVFSNVMLLVHGSNVYYDVAGNSLTPTGNAAITHSQYKFGGSSMYFDGTNSYVAIPYNANLDFNYATSFTIEAWVYLTGSRSQAIYSSVGGGSTSGSPSYGFLFGIDSNNHLWFQSNGAAPDIHATNITLSVGTWTYVYLSKVANSPNYTFYANGVTQVISNSTVWYSTSAGTSIGSTLRGDYPYYFAGEIQDLRVSNAVSSPILPTTQFYEPVDPYTNIIQMNFEGTNGTTQIYDYCGNSWYIGSTGTSLSTTQAKFGNSSLYLNGSSWLVCSSNPPEIAAASTFTVAAWVYIPSLSTSTYQVVFSKRQVGTTNGYTFSIRSNGALATWNGTTELDSPTGLVSTATWTHVAWIYSSGVLSIFVNGVLSYSASYTFSANTYYAYIGSSNAGQDCLTGYIDDFKISLSNTYPSTTFTTSTLVGVLFLSHFDGTNNSTTFVDVIGHSILSSGSPIISTTYSMFGGSSLYLNGSSYLYLGSVDSLFTIGTQDITFECWIYCTLTPTTYAYSAILSTAQGGTNGDAGLFLSINNGYLVFRHWVDGNSNAVSSTQLSANTWYHVAGVKHNGALYVFLNGVKGTTGSTSATTQSNPFYIGAVNNPGGYATQFTGYIDEVKISIGAQYTANFTPPTSAFSGTTATSNTFTPPSKPNILPRDNLLQYTTLLIHGNGTNSGTTIVDVFGNSLTNNGVITSTTQSYFNGSSLYFNGSSILSIPGSWSFSTDFTIECFAFFSSVSSQQCIITNYTNSTSGWAIQLSSSGTLEVNLAGDSYLITGTTLIVSNTWYYINLSRTNGTFTLSLNGTQEGSPYTGASNLTGSTLYIGAVASYGHYLNGYLAEIRVTNGVSRPITKPTRPFPNI